MSVFGKVKLGVNRKKYSHPFSVDINTTMNWGVCQPSLMHLLHADETIKGDFKELVRLAPLPCPSFARMYKEVYLRFVPAAEVCPYYECIASKTVYSANGKSFYPTTVPVVDNKMLVFYLICKYCSFNTLLKSNGTWSYTTGSLTSAQVVEYLKTFYSLQPIGSSVFETILNQIVLSGAVDYTNTMESSDFVLRIDDNTILLCRLNGIGKVVRNVFIGCGFSLNIMDNTPLSILPLLSFYKAYFDSYFPTREKNWNETFAYQFINSNVDNYVTNGAYYTFSYMERSLYVSPYSDFFSFLGSFENLFATQSLNFFSANRVTPLVSFSDVDVTSESDTPTNVSNANEDGKYAPTVSGNISLAKLQALERLTRFVSKDSVIGKSLSKWIQVHYGVDVYNTIFRDSNKIGYYRTDMYINDIYSTADTAANGEGNYLGGYAGRSLTLKDGNRFEYTANTVGYVVGVTSILPDSNFFQGNSFDLYEVDYDTIYIKEFDGLGYESTPYSMLQSDNGYATSTDGAIYGTGFGFIPRYSRMKCKKNVVNGDMSRRGTLLSMSPYYLDRYLSTFSYDMTETSDGKYNLSVNQTNLPHASIEWQYPTKNGFMGNFNRIFYNSGVSLDAAKYGNRFDYLEMDDNFLCQSVFQYTVSSPMLPVSQSYDTVAEDDNNVINVQNQ